MDSNIINYAKENNITGVKKAIKDGNDINLRDDEGDSALIWAAIYNNKEVVEVLLENGADINLRDNEGETALIWTAIHNYIDIAKILLKNGANTNIQNKHGETALMFSASHGNNELIKILLENGADINLQDRYKNKAFDLAKQCNNCEIMQILEYYSEKKLAIKTLKDMTNNENCPTFEELCKVKEINSKQTSLLDIVAYNVPPIKAQWFQNKMVEVYKLTPEKVADMPDSVFKKRLKKHFEKHAYFKKMQQQKNSIK